MFSITYLIYYYRKYGELMKSQHKSEKIPFSYIAAFNSGPFPARVRSPEPLRSFDPGRTEVKRKPRLVRPGQRR